MKLNFNHIKLYKDNYNIYNLIKKINSVYTLFYDIKNLRFLIVDSEKNEICLTAEKIDSSVLLKLQKTRVENSKNIFDEIEINNAKIEEQSIKHIKQKTCDFAADYINLSKRTNKISEIELKKLTEGDYA